MQTNLHTGEFRELITGTKYHPAVSVILPFAPHMRSKAEVEFQLKKALSEVEKKLCQGYTSERALPVIIKLHKLLLSINYNNFKKSIAIFASPFVEKILYLDFEVEQKIVVDDSFEMRDLIYCKKQVKEYLVLVLSACSAVLYIGNCHKLVRIKANISQAYKMPGDKETDTKGFFHKMDQELALILNAHPFPIFVLGTEQINTYYKKATHNNCRINSYINGDYINASAQELLSTIKPYTSEWNKTKQIDLLQQAANAGKENKLYTGIDAVWSNASHKKSKLLLVEKDFVCLALKVVKEAEPAIETNLANPFYIKDAVDDIIEKVLESNGDVEFLDRGSLSAYGQIALIEY